MKVEGRRPSTFRQIYIKILARTGDQPVELIVLALLVVNVPLFQIEPEIQSA